MKLVRTVAAASFAAFSFVVMLVGTTAPAQAQATRTWVSGVGDDANPCSRTAPCKTFAGAISKTATGGEINCLDPGGFGGVTIVKSISIVCQYTEGGILSAGAGVNGIVVNAPATSHIYLKGLDLHGAGNAQNGLRVLAAASVTLEESSIRAYNAANGLGISFQPSATTTLTIINSTISNNGSGATGGGIFVQPTGAAGNARLVLKNVRVINNANNALSVNSAGNTAGGGNLVSIEDSDFRGSTFGINLSALPGTNVILASVSNSMVTNNTTAGLRANGGAAVFRAVSDTTIFQNGTGVLLENGATAESFGDNQLHGNGVDGAFTPPVIAQE